MNQRDISLEAALARIPKAAVAGLVDHLRGNGAVVVDFGWRDGVVGGNPVGLVMTEARFRQLVGAETFLSDSGTLQITHYEGVVSPDGWHATEALDLALGAFPKWAAQFVESATEPLPTEARARLLDIAEYVLGG